MSPQTRVTTDIGRVKRTYRHVQSGRISATPRDLISDEGIDLHSLLWYLVAAYVPGEATLFSNISCLPGGAEVTVTPDEAIIHRKFKYEDLVTDEFLDRNEEQLIAEGARRWKEAVERTLEQCPGPPVVPISGGMDSRAILAELLKTNEPKSIHTYTFGVPGSWDFEFGCLVARETGTNHHAYDLTAYEFSQERLETMADLYEGCANIFLHTPVEWVLRDLGASDCTHWIGYMGDPSVGSHIPSERKLDSLGNRYSVESNRFATSTQLEECLDQSITAQPLTTTLPSPPSKSTLSPEELWDFYNRQERYVAPIIFPRTMAFAAPFLDPEWLRFSLSLPHRYRVGQQLYKKILLSAYPKLFSLPVKSHYGVPLSASPLRVLNARVRNRARTALRRFSGNTIDKKTLNYIDFESGLRERADLKKVVRENLDALKKREFIRGDSIEKLWDAHQRGTQDHAKALTLLASLEVILRVYGRNNRDSVKLSGVPSRSRGQLT